MSDAVGLVKQLEALTGAVDYEEAIAQHSMGLEHLAASMEDTKAEIDRCVVRRFSGVVCCAILCCATHKKHVGMSTGHVSRHIWQQGSAKTLHPSSPS